MQYQALHRIPPVPERAIVINVATEVITTVAIASVLRNLDMPLLVLNCTPTPVSKTMLDGLAAEWNFDIVDYPLASHGITLDRIFQEVHADHIVLVDSDAEVLTRESGIRMRSALQDTGVYGSGWVHPTQWLAEHEKTSEGDVLYAERPWIPFAMFRTAYVRAAIANGASFREVFDLGGSSRLHIARSFAGSRRPAAIHGDTGAEIHSWLVESGFRFDGPDVAEAPGDVKHYHGVTRMALTPSGSGNGTPLDAVENEVLQRIRSEYAEYWPGFASAVNAAQAMSLG